MIPLKIVWDFPEPLVVHETFRVPMDWLPGDLPLVIEFTVPSDA